MTDPEDGADRDGPSEDPPDEDPFVYPTDADADDDADADRTPAADDTPGAGPASGAAGDAGSPASSRADSLRSDASRGETSRSDASRGETSRSDASRSETNPRGSAEQSPRGIVGWLRWFWTADSGAAVYARDVITSVAAVLLVGLVLFAISGIWPPMVAVESPSMEPNMNTGDLVFVVDNDRFVPDAAVTHDGRTTGVVPADRAAQVGYTEFDGHGDVIIFMPNGDDRRTPVIHRAMLFVEENEDWYDRAAALDPEAVGTADSCDELNNCPAPHAGFVTKGDNNEKFDQQTTLSSPVRPAWIIGTAELRVPYLGYVRLAFSGQVAPGPGRVAATAGRGGAPGPTTSASLGPSGPSPTVSSPGVASAGGAGRPVP